ncbi:MAG: hypothetical protein ACAH83_05615 [Alphaproteobacteria bacterium]
MTLEDRIASIEQRNDKVTQDKAWETSRTRRAAIALTTYICACLTFIIIIPSSNWYFAALVPTGGYCLSTLGLPWLRAVWEKRHSP